MMELTFEEFVENTLDTIRYRLKKHMDFVLVIFGPEGSGKSNFALALAEAIKDELKNEEFVIEATKQKGKVSFDPLKNVVYHLPELIKVWNEGLQIIWIDEAINVLYSKEHMGNSFLAKKLMRGRFYQNIIIANIPNPRWLDPVVREHRARALIMTDHNPQEGYFARVINPKKLFDLLGMIKYHGYMEREKFDKFTEYKIVDIPCVREQDPKLWEAYNDVKRAEDKLGDLLDTFGFSEKRFMRVLNGIIRNDEDYKFGVKFLELWDSEEALKLKYDVKELQQGLEEYATKKKRKELQGFVPE